MYKITGVLSGHQLDDWLVIAVDEEGHDFFVDTEMWVEWDHVGAVPLAEKFLEDLNEDEEILARLEDDHHRFTHAGKVIEKARELPYKEYQHDDEACTLCMIRKLRAIAGMS